MRKLTLLLTPLLVLALILTAVGCGSNDEETKTPTPTQTGQSTATLEPTATGVGYTGEKFTFKFSHQQAPGTSVARMIEYMDERLQYHTDGKAKLEIFPLGSLYTFYEEFDACATGAIDMVSMSDMSPVIAGLMDFMIGYLGFFWGETRELTAEHDKRFQEHPEGGGKLAAQLEGRGIKLLGVPQRAGVTTNITKTKEMTSQYDQDGMKIRSVGGMADLLVDAVGAIGVTLDTAEVNIAFEQGMIEVIATNPDSILSQKLYESAKYGLSSSPVAAHAFITMNLKVWNKLSPELQDIWTDKVMPEVMEWARANSLPEALDALEKLEELGMGLHWMSPEERIELRDLMFREALSQGYLKYMDQDIIKLADQLRSEPYDTGIFYP